MQERTKPKSIELLAPARDLECGISAIECGADAVYLGAPKFGARGAAGNSLAEIAELIAFAHRYYAKIYVTVNTILTNTEIAEARDLICRLYDLGADAIIIQDFGLLETDLPPIPLIASTQMHNHTVAKVKFLEQVGFKRAILARELTLTQIAEIANSVKIELECFIHGALCVCYSGQCYLSYAIGGRSGNRGECAQPCRKKYSLTDQHGKIIVADLHLLSLKDLNLSGQLQDLVAAGVTSFKIEGRLKDVNYIKNVVSAYRRELDGILKRQGLARASSGTTASNLEPNLAKTFHRGYSDYFLHGRSHQIASPQTVTHLGEYVGQVQTIGHDHFTLAPGTPHDLRPGDGICFLDGNNTLQGTNINRTTSDKIFPQNLANIAPGRNIYRNLDHAFFKQLGNAKLARQVAIRLSLIREGANLVLTGVDEDDVTVSQRMAVGGEVAQNRALAVNNWETQLRKSGSTEFVVTQIIIDLEQMPFVPVKAINELRRNLLDALRAERERQRPQERRPLIPNAVPYPETKLLFSANILNDYARRFYERHGVVAMESAAEAGQNLAGQKVMTTKHCLKYEYGMCPREGNSRSAPDQLYLVDELGKKYRLGFNCQACVMEVYF